MQPSTYPASIFSVFLPHSLPQTQIFVSSFIMSASSSKTLCDSHCLQNQVQIPKPSSQELASATVPSISTLEFPLCARCLLFIPPNPHSACLYWLSSGEPGCGISLSSPRMVVSWLGLANRERGAEPGRRSQGWSRENVFIAVIPCLLGSFKLAVLLP